MLKIEKVKKEFKIFFGGNFDLYWDCSYIENILELGDIFFI